MKKIFVKAVAAVAMMCVAMPAMAQFNLKKAVGAAANTVKAVTLTDEQIAEYVKEYIDWMGKHNPVTPAGNPYTIRLNQLSEVCTSVEGLPLNF